MTLPPSPSHTRAAEGGPGALLQAAYWRSKRRLTLQLLAIWLGSTFFVIYFARDLNNLKLFGWPLSYYMAAQGLALVYLALIVIYNRRILRMEAQMEKHMDEQMKAERQHAG